VCTAIARSITQVGYKRRPGKYGTKPAVVAANQLQQDFNVSAPDTVWVTDITYIRTHEGWLCLAAVIDLYSRKVVGWSMGSRMQTSLALNALLMAVWRRIKWLCTPIKAHSLPAMSGVSS